MKVGIVTWNSYYNYGTFLQAFAMQTVLKSMGISSYIIDDKKIIDQNYKKALKVPRFIPRCLLSLMLTVHSHIKVSETQRKVLNEIKNKFINFKRTKLNLSNKINGYDAYVAGSDQIWSPSKPFDEAYQQHYFLANIKGRKIAYAPSLRVSSEDINWYSEKVKKWVNAFDFLSARESHGVEFLRKITSTKVEQVIDPTLLLSKQQWINALDIHVLDCHKYCLVYLLTYRPNIIQYTREYAKAHDMEMIVVMMENMDTDDIDKKEYVTPDPTEFVQLILNCALVVTDSFHAAVFSSILEKDYVIYQRFIDGPEILQNQRVLNLFKLLESKNGFVIPTEAFDESDIHHDNLSSKSFKLAKQHSLSFLKHALL